MAKYNVEVARKPGAPWIGGKPKDYAYRVAFQGEDYGVDCQTLREARIYANALKHGLTYNRPDIEVQIWVAAEFVGIPPLEEGN